MADPFDDVGRSPEYVEKLSLGGGGRVVGPATEEPHPTLENGTAADHAALRPERLAWRHSLPGDPICRVPDIAVEGFFFLRESRHGLTADDPDFALEGKRVVQGPWSPGHRLVLVY